MATLATTKDAVTAPLLTEQVPEVTAPPDSEHAESLGENPDPEICTVAPGRAADGFSVIEGAAGLILKLPDAESPPGLAVAVTV